MGFAAGFHAGQSGVERGLRLRDERTRREELQAVAAAKPEESQGYTADQGAELEAAANRGDKIDIQYKDDGQGNQVFDRYVVTPQAVEGQVQAPQSRDVAMQGVTDFMGKRTAGSMTDGQVDHARQMAMADVIQKYDPMEGMRLRREIKTQQREDHKWNSQVEYEKSLKDAYSTSRYGQNETAYKKQMDEYQKKMSEYEAAKASGKSGPELGIAPVAPTKPQYSVGDALADRAALIDVKAKAGKLEPEEFGKFTELLNKAQSEGYEKVLRLAQSGANLQEVAKAYNANGNDKFDPASVVSDKMVKGKDGVETRVIQFKDAQGNTQTINALAELDAMGKASDVFTRHFQKKQDARADASHGKDATKANAAVALYQERNPKASKAELDAVRSGILEPVPMADKNAPSEVKLAKAMVDAGLATDMRSGLEMAITKKSQSPKEAYLDLMKPQNGGPPREEDVSVVMETAFGSDWRNKVRGKNGGNQGGGAPKVNSRADLEKLEKGARYTAPDGTVRVKQ